MEEKDPDVYLYELIDKWLDDAAEMAHEAAALDEKGAPIRKTQVLMARSMAYADAAAQLRRLL